MHLFKLHSDDAAATDFKLCGYCSKLVNAFLRASTCHQRRFHVEHITCIHPAEPKSDCRCVYSCCACAAELGLMQAESAQDGVRHHHSHAAPAAGIHTGAPGRLG